MPTNCSYFFKQGQLLWLHMHGLSFTLKSWAEFLAFMSAVYAWPLLSTTVHNLHRCEQPVIETFKPFKPFNSSIYYYSNGLHLVLHPSTVQHYYSNGLHLVTASLFCTDTRCTYSQCMPRAHFITFESTGDTCALLFVGVVSTFGTVGHVQQ